MTPTLGQAIRPTGQWRGNHHLSRRHHDSHHHLIIINKITTIFLGSFTLRITYSDWSKISSIEAEKYNTTFDCLEQSTKVMLCIDSSTGCLIFQHD